MLQSASLIELSTKAMDDLGLVHLRMTARRSFYLQYSAPWFSLILTTANFSSLLVIVEKLRRPTTTLHVSYTPLILVTSGSKSVDSVAAYEVVPSSGNYDNGCNMSFNFDAERTMNLNIQIQETWYQS